MQGYGGRMLFVDVTTGATRVVTLAENTARALLGGNGLAARVLLDHVPAGIDAFDPANAVVFAVGPVTDTTVPGNSRACVAAKSPLTGLFFDSTFGGRFPATLKRTGFDAVVITGRAAAPSYVSVDESGAQVKPAAELWGRSTREAVNALIEAEGADADAIAIGPAGEQRVRFAAMAHYWKNREGVSGRGGIGAVLGSKNIKAVVVRGARKTAIADPAALRALLDETREPLRTGTKALSTFGTPFLVGPINALGALGSYNLRTEVFAEARAIGGESLKEHYHDRDTTCLKCPVACGKQYAIADGEFAGTRAKMPEYESIFALGPMLGIANPEALILANELCDLLGMDTISMGVSLAFVCEALERGWLTPAEVGVPFGWGDWRGMLKLVEMTARREGFGARLAEGAWRLAESVHPEGTRLVYAVKRLELPAHSARALKGLSIGYATATRGGSHHDTRPTPQYAPTFDRRGTTDKPAFAARSQNFTAVGRLTRPVPLHLRARLRPVRRRAVRPDGARGHRLEHGRRGARAGRGADHQPRADVQRARGRAPRAGRAAVEGHARADSGGTVGRDVLPARGARRDARCVLRPARLEPRRRAHARPARLPRTLIPRAVGALPGLVQ